MDSPDLGQLKFDPGWTARSRLADGLKTQEEKFVGIHTHPVPSELKRQLGPSRRNPGGDQLRCSRIFLRRAPGGVLGSQQDAIEEEAASLEKCGIARGEAEAGGTCKSSKIPGADSVPELNLRVDRQDLSEMKDRSGGCSRSRSASMTAEAVHSRVGQHNSRAKNLNERIEKYEAWSKGLQQEVASTSGIQ
jgi:hypothetical protein